MKTGYRLQNKTVTISVQKTQLLASRILTSPSCRVCLGSASRAITCPMPRVKYIHTHSSILVHQTQEKIRKSAYVRYSLCVEQPYCFPSMWHWDCARMLEEAAHEAVGEFQQCSSYYRHHFESQQCGSYTTATILNPSSARQKTALCTSVRQLPRPPS